MATVTKQFFGVSNTDSVFYFCAPLMHFAHQFMQQLIRGQLGSFISLLNHAFSPTGLLRRRSIQSWKDPRPSHDKTAKEPSLEI